MPPERRSWKKRSTAGSTPPLLFDVAGKGAKLAARKKQKCCLLDRLPNEILGEIFTYLSWSQRGEYMSVCKHWRDVILGYPALWWDPPLLKDTPGNIISKLVTLRARSEDGLRSLSLHVMPDANMQPKLIARYWHRDDFEILEPLPSSSLDLDGNPTQLHQVFPHKSLKYFNYRHDAGDYTKWNEQLWACLLSCQALKELEWSTCLKRWYYKYDLRIDFCIGGHALEQCRLEKFILNIGYKPDIDNSFLGMISQVKRLHLNGRFRTRHLALILDNVKDTVEDLYFAHFIDDEIEDDEMPSVEALEHMEKNQPIINMPKLNKYRSDYWFEDDLTRNPLPTPYRINAPQVKNLSFMSVASFDWVLLESCRNTLKSFSFDAQQRVMDQRLVDELFNMPELEELRLASSVGDYEPTEEYSHFFQKFWMAIETGKTDKLDVSMRCILPKLRKLTIIDDTELSFGRIMKLLHYRTSLQLTPIEELIVWYHDVDQIDDIEIEIIKLKVPIVDMRNTFNWSTTNKEEEVNKHTFYGGFQD